MIHVCPECGYNDVIEDKVISGHKEVINMTDKEDRWEDEKYIVDILRYCNVWRTKEVDDGIMEVISCIRSEAARTERERCAEIVERWYENEFYDDDGLKDAILTPESATEPRTCETCANEWDALTKEEMWDIIQRIRELTGNDGTESPEQTVARLVEERPATPHPVSTEDVITIRSALNALSEIRRDIQAIEQYEEWSGGIPNYGTCRTFGRIKDIANNSSKALAALDRIAGKGG